MQPNNPNQPPYQNNGQPPAYNQPPQGYNPNQPPQGYPPNYSPPPPYYAQGVPPGGAPRKKGMPGCVVALLVVVAVVVVLGVVGVVTGVVTGSFSFSTGGPMQVTEATMAKGFANNAAVNPTSTFSTTDNPFYCVVKVENTTAGAVLKGVWTAVDAGSAKNQQIASKTLTLEGGNNFVAHFDLSMTNNTPTGSYKFEVFLNDTLAKTLNFTIQ